MARVEIGYFPYETTANPYQRLFADAIEGAGMTVRRLPPRKWFPLQSARAHAGDLLQLDWPHDWYLGRSWVTQVAKNAMYRDGLSRLRDFPLVWTAHNLHAHDASDMGYEHRMIQKLIDVCDGVIVLSNVSERLLRSEYRLHPRTRVAVIQHGHYIDCYPNAISRDSARRRLNLPENGRVVLSLGRLQRYKGVEDLIEAFGDVAAQGDTLLLAGQPSSADYEAELRRLMARKARRGIGLELRSGPVPDAELQTFFNGCDLVALPFRQVLNSGSLLLAMSFGRPVVAPRLGSIPEVACPEGWFGYEPSDPAGLSNAIAAGLAVTDPGSLRRRILDFTATHYDWGTVGTKVAALYSAILDPVTGGNRGGVRD